MAVKLKFKMLVFNQRKFIEKATSRGGEEPQEKEQTFCLTIKCSDSQAESRIDPFAEEKRVNAGR